MSPKTPLEALAYTAIDLEATGLDPTRDRPVALGAVRLVGGRLGAELELLLDPGRPVRREAQALHGLSREALKGRPTLKEALPPLPRLPPGHGPPRPPGPRGPGLPSDP